MARPLQLAASTQTRPRTLDEHTREKDIMTTIDNLDLYLIAGGAAKAARTVKSTTPKATYGNMCVRGAIDGGINGASGGAGMLPFAFATGGLTPVTAGLMVGGGTAVGAVVGCGSGMWELYKARHPVEP